VTGLPACHNGKYLNSLMTSKDAAARETELQQLRAELERCRKQLLEANELSAIGQLLAGIVHEINTPIGSILSNNEVAVRSLELLKNLLDQAQAQGKPPPPKAARVLSTLMSLAAVDKIACERIVSVVRGLKTLVGGPGAEFVDADLNEILDNTLKLARCEFRRRVRVETDYGDIPKVRCNPNKLGQVFLNILVNAGQAIEGEGKVVIHTERDGEFVHVAISDTGSGIPPEHRDRIFSSGFTTKPSGVGTGLGLAISRDIVVSEHGGTIDFESEVGEGTTFHIRIPITRKTEERRS